jgi:hypothetical protein
MHGHRPIANVDRHCDPLAEPHRGSGEELVVERSGADQHARGAGHQRGVDRVEAAITATDLKRQARRCDA